MSIEEQQHPSIYHHPLKWMKFIASEIGLITLFKSPKDVYFLIILRSLRLFSFSGLSLIYVLYLKELGLTEDKIGIFLTLIFIGDVITSFGFAIISDHYGRKKVLTLATILMFITSLAYVFASEQYWILLLVSILGIIPPGGGDVGPFRALEESCLSTIVPVELRSDVYVWYAFSATFSAALGSVIFGYVIQFFQDSGVSVLESYKVAFVFYSAISVLMLSITLFLTKKVEYLHPSNATEETPLIQQSQQVETPKKKFRLVPELDPESVSIVVRLSLLLGLDSFASSLAQPGWQSYYIKWKFNTAAGLLGTIFFITGFVSGFMSLFSTSLSKRLGPIVTMVGTHLPSSILLALLPFPNSLKLTLVLLTVRASTQTMDVAPRHVFMTSLIRPQERTAVLGWINVVKTLCQCVGPVVTGYLTSRDMQWLCFVMAGTLKSVYDIGILISFLTLNKDIRQRE